MEKERFFKNSTDVLNTSLQCTATHTEWWLVIMLVALLDRFEWILPNNKNQKRVLPLAIKTIEFFAAVSMFVALVLDLNSVVWF